MVFDTDVLIWCIQGNGRAAAAIERDAERSLSVVSRMELVKGARNKRELALVGAFLKDLGFRVLPLTEAIGQRACIYMEQHFLKSALSIEDALIAATAVETRAPLCSANAKHYRPISDLALNVFRPE